MFSSVSVEVEQTSLQLPSVRSVDSLRMIGVSHETADITVRSSLALHSAHIEELIAKLKAIGAQETFILSTCNRTEVYFVGVSPAEVTSELSRFCEIDLGTLRACSYVLEGWQVVRHLFSVASGLKSAAIGESEILGQLKSAFQTARQHGSVGRIFDPLMQRSFRAAKRVRSESGLDRRGLSLGSLTVRKAFALSHGTKNRSILILGAGQIAESVAKNLHHREAKHVTLCSRTYSRAAELAEVNGFNAAPIEELASLVANANVIIGAATVSRPLLTDTLIQDAVAPGTVLIDLGVPPNVAPAAKHRPDIKLLEIDELVREVSANATLISELTPKAEALVEDELQSFAAESCEREAASCIEALVVQSEQVRRQNLEWALSQIPPENARERKLLEDLSIRIARGMISKPIKNLKTDFREPQERAVLARFFEAEV